MIFYKWNAVDCGLDGKNQACNFGEYPQKSSHIAFLNFSAYQASYSSTGQKFFGPTFFYHEKEVVASEFDRRYPTRE